MKVSHFFAKGMQSVRTLKKPLKQNMKKYFASILIKGKKLKNEVHKDKMKEIHFNIEKQHSSYYNRHDKNS